MTGDWDLAACLLGVCFVCVLFVLFFLGCLVFVGCFLGFSAHAFAYSVRCPAKHHADWPSCLYFTVQRRGFPKPHGHLHSTSLFVSLVNECKIWRKIWKINYEKQIPPKSRGIYRRRQETFTASRVLYSRRAARGKYIVRKMP